MTFDHVLVVGGGQMGAGIAQVVAASGRRVSLYDSAPGATERATETMRKSLTKLEAKGGAPADEAGLWAHAARSNNSATGRRLVMRDLPSGPFGPG